MASSADYGPPKVNCKKCGRASVPGRSGRCFYCGKPLEDVPAHAEPRQLGGPARFTPQSDDRRHSMDFIRCSIQQQSPSSEFRATERDSRAS